MNRYDEQSARNALLDRCRRIERVAGFLFRDALEARPDQLPRIEREVRSLEGRGDDGGDPR